MKVMLEVLVGDQFHQLYFALIQQRDAVLHDTLKDLGPSEEEKENFIRGMKDVALINDMITDLVTGLNFACADQQKQTREPVVEQLLQEIASDRHHEWGSVLSSIKQAYGRKINEPS